MFESFYKVGVPLNFFITGFPVSSMQNVPMDSSILSSPISKEFSKLAVGLFLPKLRIVCKLPLEEKPLVNELPFP